MLFAAASNCDCKEHLPEVCLRIHSRRLQTLTLPVILNFFFNNIYIPFCLAHIMIDGINIPLCNFQLTALRRLQRLAHGGPERVLIQNGAKPQNVRRRLPVENYFAACQALSHILFIAPG